MPQRIHFQDDLFYLSVLARSLEQGLATEADPDFFGERILGDLVFLDGSIRTFYGLLAQNGLLIERAEYLKLLERTAATVAGLLARLIGGGFPASPAFEAHRSRLAALLEGQRELLRELDTLLSSSLGEEAGTELVSEDEMSELLKE